MHSLSYWFNIFMRGSFCIAIKIMEVFVCCIGLAVIGLLIILDNIIFGYYS